MTWRQRLEVWAARAAVAGLRALGPVAASNLGGAVARWIGPWMPQSRVAEVNLRLAMPELGAQARRRIVRGWENVGRVVGEMPHLGRLGPSARGPGYDFEGLENIDALIAAGGAFILVTGHFGNWEMLPSSASRHGIDLGFFYRAAENPGIDGLINRLRGEGVVRPLHFFAKGAQGARQALHWVMKGGVLGALVDQKMNDGVAATWFGHTAMTSSAVAAMAVRLRCPLLPVYTVRRGPARVTVVIEPVIPLPPPGGERAATVLGLTQAINDRQEGWVRRTRAGWLWLHRRYDKSVYRRAAQSG